MSLLLREALLAFRRAPLLSALSVITIGFALYAVSLFGLVAVNLRSALHSVEQRVEVVAYLLRGTPAETVALASQDIAAFPEVKRVTFVSEDEALHLARRELVEFRDAYRDLTVNPLPASLEIELKDGYQDAEHTAAVADRLRGYGFVDDVRYGREWIENLDRLRNIAALVGLSIGIAFAAVAIVIIGVTIRIAVLQRAREISIMRLVGATNGFIRGPFLLEGALKGLLGGLLAVGLCYGTYQLFHGQVALATSGIIFLSPRLLALGVLFGISIGFGGSAVSVGRHLRNV
jgi:cell division transport system permease protein